MENPTERKHPNSETHETTNGAGDVAGTSYRDYPAWYTDGIPIEDFESFSYREKKVAAVGFLDCGDLEPRDVIEKNFGKKVSETKTRLDEVQELIETLKRNPQVFGNLIEHNQERLRIVSQALDFCTVCRDFLLYDATLPPKKRLFPYLEERREKSKKKRWWRR